MAIRALHLTSLLLLCLIISLSAQTPSAIQPHLTALEALDAKATTTERLNQYTSLLTACLDAEQYQSAHQYLLASTDLYLQCEDSIAQSNYALVGGDVYHYQSNYLLADQYFRKSLALLGAGPSLNHAELNLAIADNLIYTSRYEESLQFAYKALDLYQTYGNEEEVAEAKNLLVVILVYLKQNELAKEIVAENQQYYASHDNEEAQMSLRIDLANIYMDEQATDSSEHLGLSVYHYYEEQGDLEGMVVAAYMLSSLYIKTEAWSSALTYLSEIIAYVNTVEDKRDLHLYHLDIGIVKMHLGRYQEAKEHFQKYRQIGIQVGEQRLEVDFQRAMQDLMEAQGRYAEALHHAKRHDEAKDSLVKAQEIKTVQELNAQYALAEKEKELREERQENDRLQDQLVIGEQEKALITSRRNLWIVVIAALATVLLILINRRRLKQKKEKELSESRLVLAQQELEHQSAELEQYTQSILEKTQLLEQFEQEIETLSQRNDVAAREKQEKLEALYQLKILTDEDWQRYKQLFNQVYPDYLIKLNEEHEGLTEGDRRYLILQKLGMEARQMAQILGVSQSSIRVSRHRLKKKLEGQAKAKPEDEA